MLGKWGSYSRLLLIVIGIILRHQVIQLFAQSREETGTLLIGLGSFGLTLTCRPGGLIGALLTFHDRTVLISVEFDTGLTVRHHIGSLCQQREYLDVFHAVDLMVEDVER